MGKTNKARILQRSILHVSRENAILASVSILIRVRAPHIGAIIAFFILFTLILYILAINATCDKFVLFMSIYVVSLRTHSNTLFGERVILLLL